VKYHVVSRYLLGARARAILVRLADAQKQARKTDDLDARGLLAKHGVGAADRLRVERASRGPWRWYVVAG
jgi:hypothetical protein